MKIGILTIGNELMNGRTADTNSSFIAREINLQGWQVEAMMSVGDDFAAIKSRLHYLLTFTDAVICTGGLGPTADDITTAAIAQAFGLPLYTDENVLQYIKDNIYQIQFALGGKQRQTGHVPAGRGNHSQSGRHGRRVCPAG